MEVVRTYHDNKQLKEEYCLINNKIEGLYKNYCDEKLYKICNYVNGQLNGEFKQYYENGHVLVVIILMVYS